jgi:hypothetical protein
MGWVKGKSGEGRGGHTDGIVHALVDGGADPAALDAGDGAFGDLERCGIVRTFY